MTKQSHRTSKVVHQQPNPYDLPPAPPSPAASTKSVESHHSNWSLDSVPISLPNAPATITMTQAKPTSNSIDLLIRPSWIDAEIALIQIEKGKANGNKSALWLRSLVQGRFFELGQFIQLNAGQLLFIACLVLATMLIGLRSVDLETRVEKLWVEEGGRLEKELRYLRQTLGEGAGTTNQIIIQTPKAQSSSVLHPNALLLHLQVMRIALVTTVEMFDTTWDIKDICYTANAPNFENPALDSVIEHLMPCSIITPLDCFWDGSKMQGPYSPRTVHVPGVASPIKWTSFNPEMLMDTMATILKSQQKLDASFTYIEMVRKFMIRAGISTAYQKKPCLDPNDGLCPWTAPNHDLATAPDIGAELTGGCYGFATNYMHWAEELIVGGVTKNRSGHIVKARALQSVVQLMGEKNMFEYYKDHYKVHNLDWSISKARLILEDWQRKFAYEVRRFMATTDFAGSRHYDFHLFTSTSLTDIMSDHSNLNPTRLAMGFVLILLYSGFALSRWRRMPYRVEKSQCFLGVFGVSILGLAGAAGAGVCGFIGLQFNVASTQIVPFFALGLGIDNMFLIAATYASDYMIRHVPHESRTAECLKQTGPSILLSSLCTVAAFLAAAIIPIPALRCFALQTAILITFISVAVIVLFPALASIDLRFRSLYLSQIVHSSSSDLSFSTTFFANLWFYLCCCRAPRLSKLAPQLSPPALSPLTSSHLFRQPYLYKQPYNCYYLNSIQTIKPEFEQCEGSKTDDGICRCEAGKKILDNSEEMRRLVSRKCFQCGGDLRTQCDGQDEESVVIENIEKSEMKETQQGTTKPGFTWKHVVAHFYAPLLQRRAVKVLVLLFYIVVTVMAVLGALRVNDGLDLTDIVPKSSMEHRFLEAQQKFFTYYNVYAVTKGNFDYPNNQRLLYEYHASFTRIGAIIKNDDGGPPDFWLSMFRDWLLDLQQAFDRDWARGCITRDNWFTNASTDGIMAYKLLVQTGRVDNPVDKSLVLKGRLVDDQGIINPKAFYNYLSAWATVDPLAYETSQASLHPEPREWRIRMPFEVELKIPKSQPLQFSQIPFQLVNIRTTEDIVSTVEEIRAICTRFEDRGLPNFPTGVPFTYWEQYIRLRFYLLIALVAILTGIFVYISIMLVSPWTAILLVFVLVLNVSHLFGLMGWLDIRLSAIPAVILIASIGISLSSLMHITLSFLTSIGDRNRRMSMALIHMATPVKHAILSTMVGISLLAFSEFEFIIRYFFYLLALFAAITFLNSFLLLPVLLSIVGPSPEVIPLEHTDRLSTPSPPPSPLAPPMCPSYLDVLLDPPPRVRKSRRMHSTGHSASAGAGNVFQRYRSRRVPHRVQSEISLSTISEEPNSYQSTPTPTPPMCRGTTPTSMAPLASGPSHEMMVQPEFVVETTITNKGGCNSTTSVSPTSVTGGSSSSASSDATTSPSPTSSDRDSPSGRSESTTSGRTSRCGSAASFTTTTTTTEQQSQSTTVKVMTKLTVELPPGGNAYPNPMGSYPIPPGVWVPSPGASVPSTIHHYHPPHHHPPGHPSCLPCQQASFDFGATYHRTGAWNHGMIGQNQNSNQMQRGQSNRHLYWR